MKHPVPDCVKPSFVIFDIWALWRSGLMSKYTHDSLTQSAGTGCFIVVPIWQQWALKGWWFDVCCPITLQVLHWWRYFEVWMRSVVWSRLCVQHLCLSSHLGGVWNTSCRRLLSLRSALQRCSSVMMSCMLTTRQDRCCRTCHRRRGQRQLKSLAAFHAHSSETISSFSAVSACKEVIK